MSILNPVGSYAGAMGLGQFMPSSYRAYAVDFDGDGYPINQLKKDLEDLTGVKVLGSIPFIDDMSDESLYKIFKKNIDMKLLLK